jgi:predicted TIM-barrel fold metal-dependent hydrolase
MKIFDANTHIEKNPLSIRLKELNSWHEETDEGLITHYATVQDILNGMKKHGIASSLVMPNSVTPDREDAKKVNEIIGREIAGYTSLVGAATVHPHSKTAVYDLEESILENGLRVLMFSPDRQGFELNDEALWILLERVEEMGTPVILHALWSKDASEYFNLRELFDVGSSFHIDFILTHMGAGAEISPLSEVAELENIYFETSHIKPKDILHAIDLFGSKRLIFGSDFSYNLYPKYELEKILALEIEKKDLELIMGKNLEGLLK